MSIGEAGIMKVYSREEALKKSTEYFKGNTLAAEVFVSKYALRDKKLQLVEATPYQMHKRIASEFARIEKKFPNPLSEEEIFNLLDQFKYLIPGGSPMFGIGNIYQKVSLSNCFVIDTVDSYGGICRSDERIAQISKRRGGVGLDISAIRPKGVPTRNSAFTTDGITVFMERFSNTSREVAQSGRRGALMQTISIHHPEVLNFIRIKRDLQKVTGANISVRVTDEFMDAVRKDKKYEQRWPVDSDSPTISNKVRARDIWDELVKSNYMSAEPGVLFWDNILKNSPADCYAEDGFKTVSTNPSLRKDTLVLTNKGVYPIEELAESKEIYKVLNIRGEWHDCDIFKSGKNKQLVKITFTNGQIVYCTKEHKWPIFNTSGNIINPQTFKVKKKQTINLKRRDKIYLPYFKEPIDNKECLFNKEDGFILGWNQGDGWISVHTGCNNVKQYGFIFNQKDVDNGVSDRILTLTNNLAKTDSKLHRDHGTNSFSYTTTDNSVRDYMSKIGATYKKNGVPKTIWKGNKEFIKGYIEGLFSADAYVKCGNTIGKSHIVFVSCHEKLVLDIQKLLSFYGIASNIRKSNSKSIFPKYNSGKTYTRYDLRIGGLHVVKFAQRFKLGNEKQNELESIKSKGVIYHESSKRKEYSNNREYLIVKGIELTNEYEDVYDITVHDDTHTFVMESGITGNCGELPLPEHGACLLMAINMASYVIDPFTDKAKFDQVKFKEHIEMAQRLMDDLVELEIEAVKKIIVKIKKDPESAETKSNELTLWRQILIKQQNGRRTGLGVTGLGDFIAMLNVKYGSDESLGLVEKVYSLLRNEAYKSSIMMAQSRGAFPIFDFKKEVGNEYLGRLPPVIRADMNKHGRRNIGCLTTAPAGSGSTVAGIIDLFGISSGFEPVFKCEYKRKRKLTDNDEDKPDYVDEQGDKWKEYIITHSGLQKFKEINGKGFEDSPYNGSEASQLDFFKRVEMQAVATQYVDHAISSTINLPIEVDLETVSKLYIAAHEQGCKGLTIYRSGTRDGVLTGIDSSRQCEDCDEASKDLVKLIEEGLRPSKIILAAAPKRPPVLECDIHRSRVGGGDWIFFVGKLNGRPYEVFGGDSQKFTIPQKYRSGWICKNGKDEDDVTQYNLILGSMEDENEKLEFKGIAKHFNNYEYGAFTRLASLTMRHGAPIRYICEQITKKGVEGDLFSFQRAMARVLKKYISEGEKSETECPICHSTDVIYKNGCPSCQLCGHSNCA